MVTSLEFVGALRRAGFTIQTVTENRIVLVKDDRTVVVRRHKVLAPSDLSWLLLGAGMTRQELEKLLARPIPRVSGEIDVTGLAGDRAKTKDG